MKKKQNKAFRKLKRLELVELIYELRKRNAELEKEAQHLQDQLDESEELRRQYAANQPNEETASKIEALMADAGIVRNRRKIEAAIQNARVFLAIQEEFGSFDRYLWGYTDGEIIVNADDEMRAHTELSDRISKDLKRRGMNFVGTTIIYSFLQATGVVNDHELGCAFHPNNQ